MLPTVAMISTGSLESRRPAVTAPPGNSGLGGGGGGLGGGGRRSDSMPRHGSSDLKTTGRVPQRVHCKRGE